MHKPTKKIALVANTAWSIYNFRRGVIRAFQSKGIMVYAIAPMDDFAHKLIADGVKFIPLYMDRYGTSVREDMKTFVQLTDIFKKYQFDKVYHYTVKCNIYASLAAVAARIPSVAVITGLGSTFEFKGWRQWAINFVYKRALMFNQEVWVLNESDQQKLLEKKFVSRDQIRILPSEGVNLSHFQYRNTHNRSRKFRFLYAGRLLKNKGILEFVEAARLLKEQGEDVHFDVVGFVHPDNPNSVSLDQLMEWQSKGWITYRGAFADIRPFLDTADCLVYPSYYNEGISRVLLEAASMQLPIITTDHPGCKEVVEHAITGLLVKTKCAKSLILAIEYFLDLSLSERQSMGKAGRELVERKYDERHVISIYLESMGILEYSKVDLNYKK